MKTEYALHILLEDFRTMPEESIQGIIDTFSWEAADYVFDTMGDDIDGMIDLNTIDPAGSG
jgi:hypothetical protein